MRRRYFSVKQLGFESARRQAILLRQQWKGDVSEEVLRALNEDSCATPTEGRAEAAETAGAEDSQSECPLTLLEETSCCGASRGKGLQESPALQKELILSRVANSSGFAVAENLGTSDLAPGRRAAATAFAASGEKRSSSGKLSGASRETEPLRERETCALCLLRSSAPSEAQAPERRGSAGSGRPVGSHSPPSSGVRLWIRHRLSDR